MTSASGPTMRNGSAFETELRRKGTVRDFEARLRVKSGDDIECLISADTITLSDRACILCCFQDITARRRSEEDLVKAIEAVMADASWFSRGVVEKLAALRHPPRPGQSPAQAAASVADLTRGSARYWPSSARARAMPRSRPSSGSPATRRAITSPRCTRRSGSTGAAL